jgi:hypothetical protein
LNELPQDVAIDNGGHGSDELTEDRSRGRASGWEG